MGQLEEEVECKVTSTQHHQLQCLWKDCFHNVKTAWSEYLLRGEIDETLELVVFESFRGTNLIVERPEYLISHY